MEGGWRKHAKRFGAPAAFLLAVTVAVLLVRDGLRRGDSADTTSVRTTVVTTKPVTTTPVPPKQRQFYRLRSGETLSDVAIRFNTTVAALEALNPGIQPTNLIVGQRIRVK